MSHLNNKIYRIAKSSYGIFLFLTPVDKLNTFLIQAPTQLHAELYKFLLDFGAILSPLDSLDLYQNVGTHTDGVTPIYELQWDDLKLEFLPQRDLDIERAVILESVIAKKFTKLFRNIDNRAEIIQDIQHRFSQQLLCSQCQKLGIDDSRLKEWFGQLSHWCE